METRLNVRSSVRTYVWIAFPHVEQVANSVYSSECIHTARRSGHFGRNPGCGTLLSYSSSCLEPVYARQVSSQRPLNRPFQVLRACSTRARMCVCVYANTGLEEASGTPVYLHQRRRTEQRNSRVLSSLRSSFLFLVRFHFHCESFGNRSVNPFATSDFFAASCTMLEIVRGRIHASPRFELL